MPTQAPVVTEPKPLTRARARALTEKINHAAENLYQLVGEAYAGDAHTALGYPSWQEYVDKEFSISRAQSYRLLNQSRVMQELEAAAGVDLSHSETREGRSGRRPSGTTDPPLVTQAQAQALAPKIDEVAKRVRKAVSRKAPEKRAAVVTQIVAQETHTEPAPRVPESNIMDGRKAAGLPLLGAVGMLITHKPTEATTIDATTWGKFETWVGKARIARGTGGGTGGPRRNRAEVEPRFKGPKK